MSRDIKEEVVKAEYWLDGIDPELHDKAQNDPDYLFRTQEKKIAIFLKARGFPVRGLEKKQLRIAGGQNKKILTFCFDHTVQRARLEYYNDNNPESYNVNAKSILDAQQDITSMIVNF
ncbi:MAG: DUF5659 domain-containing protein [Candidatus Thorarchaeota archaeon]|nr:MAG: hypothetical protein DRQ25_04935 [Candidatus Fermentibacteria bacterium]HEC72024.1 hypothetical protein [Thermoplasmatales archaeon]